ncbi:MAG TPA: DUF72 domain-containing protein [Mycobacteriales bacterium]|nr:DUF72 domain-containing protein [Mycobacteriales bacterium]HVU60223.1 DUF72 domain-containing protein [Mycobacteriales bacterium]
MIRVGTSGWQYADWRGGFYPPKLPQRLWLSAYAESFDTVEVNSSFYRLPKLDTVQRWAETVPDGFVMAMKASRYLTHIKRLREPAEPVQRLMGVLSPLRSRGLLGPVLVQLPPDLQAELGRLDQTLAAFPPDVRVAVEPRHESWFTEDLRRMLTDRGAAMVWADRGGRSLGPLWRTADWTYLRLHHGRVDWGYDDRDLARWVTELGPAATGYVYANNDPGGAAVRDARRLRTMLSARSQPAARL